MSRTDRRAGRGAASEIARARAVVRLAYADPWRAAAVLACIALGAGAGLLLPGIAGQFVDRGIAGRDLGALRTYALGGAGVVLARYALDAAQRYARFHYDACALLRLRMILYRRILRADLLALSGLRTGDLLARLSSLASRASALSPVEWGRAVIEMGTVVVLGGLAVGVHAGLGSLAIGLSLLSLLTSFALTRGVRRAAAEGTEVERASSSDLVDSLEGLNLVKAAQAEEREATRYEAILRRAQALAARQLTGSLAAGGAQSLLAALAPVLLLSYGGYLVARGALSPGDLVRLGMYATQLGGALGALLGRWMGLAPALRAIEPVVQLLDLPQEGDGEGMEIRQVRERIALRDVEFSYQEGRPVLRDISFEVRPGQVLGIVGPTGSGKTTLARLLARLYAPQRGEIQVDGLPLSRISLSSYRSLVGIVSQELFLFDRSVEENIGYRFARPPSPEELARASARALVDEFISRLPGGFEERVGSRGLRLSGGQRQRIALARELLYDPQILILDEPTAFLDGRTERRLQGSLRRTSRGRTLVIVSHRASMVREADEILVLNEGRIVDRGTHEELLGRSALYQAMLGDDSRTPTGIDGPVGVAAGGEAQAP